MKNSTKQSNYPFVSVVITTYNAGRTIEKCLQSINNQTYPNIDVVVVDAIDYPKPQQMQCKKIIEKYARYFQDGPERSRQRNRGIKEAKGEFILIIDQDMYLSSTVVAECYELLTTKNYIALTIPEISIGEGFWAQCIALERYVSVYLEEGMNECCRFFRKSTAIAIGGYDPTLVGVEDSDFHYRMKRKGAIGKIKSIIYHDEGRVSFFKRVKKKYYYSMAFREYLRKYPVIASSQFFPIKKAYFKHWRVLIKNPTVTMGMVLLRGAEVLAGSLGVLIKKKYENT